MRLLPLSTSAVLASALLFTGCVNIEFDHGSSDRFQEDFHFSYELQPNGHVIAETFNGKIYIVGWDENKVDISGTKYGSTERLRDAVKVETHNSASSVEIRASKPSSMSSGSSGARLVIKVPKQALVERVTSSNGAILVERVGSASHMKTSNGSIRVVDTAGDLELRTSNGQIEVERLKGNLSARSSNGKVRAEDVSGNCDVETSNASINIRVSEPTAAPVKLSTSNGAIELTMEKAPKGDIRAESSNGSITVKLPSNTGARVTADTSNSSISSEFDMMTQGGSDREKKNHLNGTIGSGGPTIDLTTRNGHIRILKATASGN